jgi:N-acyl-D-aspartate/D-glutamate deacylase
VSIDLAVVGGTLLDGSGAPAVTADVHVVAGRIARLAPDLGPASARTVIDARGLHVAPGFIDMHAHSDLAVLGDDGHGSRLLQGITTEVLGQDGLSYAPVDDVTLARLRTQLRGWNGDPAGFSWDWRSVDEYLARLDAGTWTNVAYLVPHGNLRLLVMGDRDGRPTPAERDAMCDLLRTSLRAGAVGLSAGLTYAPGMFADTDELDALCRVVAEEGGYFCPHHRNYGSRVFESYAECFDLARRTGVALHLAHAHVSFPQNAGRVSELVALLDAALADGVDVSFDAYPYLAGMTSLHALLPGWVQSGEIDDILARLVDPDTRARVRRELDVDGTDGNQGLPVDWATVVLADVPGLSPDGLVGLNVAQLAAERGTDASEYFLDLVVATRLGASCLLHFGIEDHVRTLMRHPAHTVGTDGILVGARPHPRGWGTFPRFLGRYVRDADVMSLPEAIRHATSSPARRLGLTDRGRLVEGTQADLVVFDAETVLDLADYDMPRRSPRGIHHVLVNGDLVVRNGALTGRRAGSALRPLTGRAPVDSERKASTP